MKERNVIHEERRLTYKTLEKSDIQKLSPIMKAAFDADTRMHTDLEEDGPKGYDNGELLQKLMQIENADSKVIYVDGMMVGEYTVLKDRDVYTLDMFFIHPGYSSKGIGSSVWKDIENQYPEAKKWIVETPDYSKRNHHFYEKCGFHKIREHNFEDGAKSFVFQKRSKEENL